MYETVLDCRVNGFIPIFQDLCAHLFACCKFGGKCLNYAEETRKETSLHGKRNHVWKCVQLIGYVRNRMYLAWTRALSEY